MAPRTCSGNEESTRHVWLDVSLLGDEKITNRCALCDETRQLRRVESVNTTGDRL